MPKIRIAWEKGSLRPAPGSLIMVAGLRHASGKMLQARLVETSENNSAVNLQEKIVKLNHEVPREFPEVALAEAAECSKKFAESVPFQREDLRSFPFVTIDSPDAKDFDDAIHVEKNERGWILRVAIADVSHFVRPRPGQKKSLDTEACRRGNSWYFPKSVEPMLPFAISNNICSLEKGKDRMVILVELHYSPDGVLRQSRFAPGIIRSHARLTYQEAQDAMTGTKQVVPWHADDIHKILSPAFRLYEILRHKRMVRGMLDFNLPEPEYQFDTAGKLAGITIAERLDAHRLIEIFMISANEAVAEFLEKNNSQFLFRVHPAPRQSDLQTLCASLEAISPELFPDGYSLEDNSPAEIFRAILAKAKGSTYEFAINRLCLRAMPQACYSPNNEGHFGLSSSAYCHFTSPIRRYADLLVHRALKELIGAPCGQTPAGPKLAHMADRLNRQERTAVDCEREMARRLGCMFLSEHIGKSFKGTISGLAPFGVFVLLDEMPVEGLIKMRDLENDFYNYDAQRKELVGEHGGIIHIGQRLEVRISHVDMLRLETRLRPRLENFSLKKIRKLKGMSQKNGPRRKDPLIKNFKHERKRKK